MSKSVSWRSASPVLRFALVGTALFTIFVIYRVVLYLRSPEYTLSRTLRAVQSRDVAGLCRLADPEELSRLHLDEAKAGRLLGDSLWTDRVVHIGNVHLMTAIPGDRRLYGMDITYDNGKKMAWQAPIVDDAKHGWRLVLTEGIYFASLSRYGEPGGKRYFDQVRALGGIGHRDQVGEYSLFGTTAGISSMTNGQNHRE